jgi:hypothetical protein
MYNLVGMLERVFDCRYFSPDKVIDNKVAIPSIWDRGTGRLVLVQGENAGGKSFFRRLVQGVSSKKGDFPVHEMIHLSMQGRSDTGIMHAPIVRALIYGDEEHFATGDISANIIRTGISTARGRTDPTIVYWDEPDIGMSNRAAAGAGVAIREFVDTLPDHIAAVFITSHNPILVAQLLQAKEKPHYIHLGNEKCPATAQDWINEQNDPNLLPRSPEDLSKAAHERFLMITSILNDKDKPKEPPPKVTPSAPWFDRLGNGE